MAAKPAKKAQADRLGRIHRASSSQRCLTRRGGAYPRLDGGGQLGGGDFLQAVQAVTEFMLYIKQG